MNRFAWRAAAVAGSVLAGAVVVAPAGVDTVLRLVLLCAVAGAMVAGVLYRRQHAVLPWWLLIASVSAFAVATVLRLTGALALLTDGAVLAGYLFLAAAGLGLVRRLDHGGDREGVLDGAIVAVAVGAVLTVLLFQPTLLEDSGTSRVHLFVGPTVFAAIAGIVTRFALLMPQRCPAAWLLVGATVAGLGGNLLRTAAVAVGDGFHTGSLPDALLLGGYVALAVAALHPSMVLVPRPAARHEPTRTRMRLLLLGAALPVPSLMLALEPPEPGRRLAVAAAMLVNVLALWRLARLFMERERTNAELHAQSRRDPLTGLANRLALDEALAAALARAQRSGRDVGVLFCDLDAFKAVNDRFGHHSGDDVLVAMAERMRRTLRAGDVLGRFAGDEFVVIAEGLDEPGAQRLASRLQEAVSDPIDIGGQPVVLSMSVGVSCGRPTDAEELLGPADEAMYRAKRDRGVRSSA